MSQVSRYTVLTGSPSSILPFCQALRRESMPVKAALRFLSFSRVYAGIYQVHYRRTSTTVVHSTYLVHLLFYFSDRRQRVAQWVQAKTEHTVRYWYKIININTREASKTEYTNVVYDCRGPLFTAVRVKVVQETTRQPLLPLLLLLLLLLLRYSSWLWLLLFSVRCLCCTIPYLLIGHLCVYLGA